MNDLEAKTFTAEDVDKRIDETIASLERAKKFSLEVSPGFAEIPPIEIVRGLREGLSLSVDTLDRLTHFAILKKTITIKADGEVIGSPFSTSGIDDPWETFEVFKQCPVALQFLFSVCESYILKKSLPPLKSSLDVAAGSAKVEESSAHS